METRGILRGGRQVGGADVNRDEQGSRGHPTTAMDDPLEDLVLGAQNLAQGQGRGLLNNKFHLDNAT